MRTSSRTSFGRSTRRPGRSRRSKTGGSTRGGWFRSRSIRCACPIRGRHCKRASRVGWPRSDRFSPGFRRWRWAQGARNRAEGARGLRRRGRGEGRAASPPFDRRQKAIAPETLLRKAPTRSSVSCSLHDLRSAFFALRCVRTSGTTRGCDTATWVRRRCDRPRRRHRSCLAGIAR
jgi:hypothetical protein